jgi:hypothetical protein
MASDNVDHPPHYTFGKIEVIDAIEDWQLGFHEGNVVKYVARAKHKGNELECLQKARWYLDRAINKLEHEKTREAFKPVVEEIADLTKTVSTRMDRR